MEVGTTIGDFECQRSVLDGIVHCRAYWSFGLNVGFWLQR